MPEKINAFVCDTCRVCCGKDEQGYPIENGWVLRYQPEPGVFCSKECAEKLKGCLGKVPVT